jgi:D-xylulose reductase
VVAPAALAGGCAKVIIVDMAQPKLDIITAYDGIEIVNIGDPPLSNVVAQITGNWGADLVFECSVAVPLYFT